MNEVKLLAGVLNYDDPDMALPLNNHADAQNIRFTGMVGNLRPENIEGNILVSNPYLPTTGNNTTVGQPFFDQVKNRTFVFNSNSLGNDGIYILNADNTWTVLLASDILAFDPNMPISSVDVLYNDDVDGDVLYFLDSLKRPTKLNIPRYIANTYNLVKREFIDVIKAPPRMPIKAAYENDFNVTINNLKNSLFNFIYRFIYDDLDKSVWSSGSITPLPFEPFDQAIDNNRFYNSRIGLYFQTGDVNVRKIEIAFRQNNVTSDYYSIQVLDKAELSIPSNTISRFAFYNDGQYAPIDMKEQVLLFDYVPQEANAQAIPNGSVVAYAGVKEGYDLFSPNLSTQSSASGYIFNINGVNLFAYQGGDDTLGTGNDITIVCTGVGTNDGNGDAISLDNSAFTFEMNAIDGTGGNRSISITNATASISAILAAILANATTVGYTLVSQTTNTLTVRFAGVKLLISKAYVQRNSSSALNSYNAAVYANKFSSTIDYGRVYYDAAGRTNSVITAASNAVNTVTAQTGDVSLYPLSILTIRDRPPLWAAYYHIVASKNLTYQKSLDWVTRLAFADATTINSQRYAYVDIGNIIEYNQELGNANNVATQGIVSYDFSVGDRIRFIRRYPLTGSAVQLTAAQYDYEIVGVSYSQNVEGIIRGGVFLKIKYPTADIGANFAFTGADFQNYQVFIYAYGTHTSLNNTVFHEIGHKRGIGNAGTAQAYHICNNQIQSSDLATNGIEYIMAGDDFSRFRIAPISDKYNFTVNESDQDTATALSITVPNSPLTTSSYILKTQKYAAYAPSLSIALNGLYLNMSTSSQQIRLRGSIPIINNSEDCTFDLNISTMNTTGTLVVIDNLIVRGSVTRGIQKNFDFDFTLNLIFPQDRAQIWVAPVTAVSFNAIKIKSFNLTVDVIQRNIQIPIIDKSFSDLYDLELNSLSRAVSVDKNAKQEFKGTLFRFSEPAQQGTNINLANRFYPNNTDQFDRAKGDVIRMAVSARQLIIFQYAGTGRVGIYAKFIKDNTGSQNLITTDTIITPNNIQYYEGGFGIRNQPLSLSRNGFQFYFADDIRGVLCRLSQDGVTPISELFKVQTWAGMYLPAYQTDSDYQFGGKAKILSCYNQLKNRHGEIIFILQKGLNGTTVTKPALSMVFDENRNAFTGSYSFNPDQIVCAGNRLFTFHNGNAYEHNDYGNNRTFYGQTYYPSLSLVFNKEVVLRKVFNTLSYISDQIWVCDVNGDIITSEVNDQTGLPQISSLIEKDFTRRGNTLNAALLQDANSSNNTQLALLEGDVLNGVLIKVKLTYKGSKGTYIYLPTVLSQEDKENLKNT